MKLRVLVGLLACTGIALVSGCGGSTKTYSAMSPTQLAAAEQSSAMRAGGFHYETHLSTGGMSQIVIGDAEPGKGQQTVTATKTGVPSQTEQVIVVSGKTYTMGNTAFWQNVGLSSTTAEIAAGKWFEVPPGNPSYNQITLAVTSESAIQTLIPLAPLSRVTLQRGGHDLVGVQGTPAPDNQASPGDTMAVYTEDSGSGLPVVAISTHDSQRSTTDLSHWDENISITAPPNAVPIPATASTPGASS